MNHKQFLKRFQISIFVILVLFSSCAYCSPNDQDAVGGVLPRISLPAPDSPATQKYLGLKGMDAFAVSDIKSKLVLIEFMSAFCPHCLKNAPIVNKLYNVIQDDPALSKDVKIIAIAVTNNQKQIDAYKKSFNVPFPIFSDEEGAIVSTVDMVDGTPTTLLVTTDGKLLLKHTGVIDDFDGFLKSVREIQKKQ